MRYRWIWIILLLGASVLAAPESGDIFREYAWAGPWVNSSRWQRVTGPDATPERAKAHLPNPVNRIKIDDLDKARKAEVTIEMLLCHGGTINKRVRVNGNAWITIPESPYIPGEAGTGPPDTEYQYMRYPCIEIPLEQLRRGENTFEFTCSGGTSLGGRWPQWIVYGVTFRIYYDRTKPHSLGRISKPPSGSTLGESPVLEVQVEGDHSIKQIGFIGFYEDFNWEGDGNDRQWHYHYHYNEMKSHIGTAMSAPYQATWNGVAADEIGINGKKVITRIGKNHDPSYDAIDVPLNLIASGTNTLYTHSTTKNHGIEVQWPGMVLLIQYNVSEQRPASK